MLAFGRDPDPLDDRGNPLPRVRHADVWRNVSAPRSNSANATGEATAQIGEEDSVQLVATVALSFAGAIGMAGPIWLFTSNPPPLLVVAGTGFGALVGFGLGSLLRRVRDQVGEKVRVGWLAAYARCGACGCPLYGIAPASDGRVPCRACGAAWHTDRWTMVDLRPEQSESLQTLLAGVSRNYRRAGWDDRFVPLALPYGWYPAWAVEAWVPEELFIRIRDPLRAVGRRTLGRMLAWMVPILIAATLLSTWALAPNTGPRLSALVEFGLFFMFVLGAVSLLTYFFAVSAEARITVVLDLGRCPNCGQTLPAGPAMFDGCVACPNCRRAWRIRTGVPHSGQ